jgi:hypothetical protein
MPVYTQACGWGVMRHVIVDGLDMQMEEDPLLLLHTHHFDSACTSCVRHKKASSLSVGPNYLDKDESLNNKQTINQNKLRILRSDKLDLEL